MTEEFAPKKQEQALIEVEQQRAVAETQGAMIIAKRFPRDPIASLDRILNACTRPKLAEVALYQYARGGTDITGPSIRLAEAIAQQWGNLSFGIRELEQRGGESTVEAFAWDIETNTRQTKTFQVAHSRYTRASGIKKLTDPRDVYELIANQGARRMRACILGIIPGDVVEAAVKACESTLKLKTPTTKEAIAEMVEQFEEYGITRKHIEERLQRHLESVTPAQMVTMKKIYNSLKDGMSSPSDWFTIVETQKASIPGVEPNGKPEYKINDFKQGVTEEEIGAAEKEEEKKKPEPPPPVAKPESLYDRLMSARSTFASLVMDPANTKEIEAFSPDQYDMVKARWENAAKKGAGGVKQGAEWPLTLKAAQQEEGGLVDAEWGDQEGNGEPGPDSEASPPEIVHSTGNISTDMNAWTEYIQGVLVHLETGELQAIISETTKKETFDWLRVASWDRVKVQKAINTYMDGKRE